MLKKRLMAKKSIAQIQNEANHCEFKRTLGKWNLLSLGIGCIIGAGIFSLTGAAAANHAGPAIMLSFICAGFACAFAGLCYAELASVLPVSGSAYTYAYATLGEVFAWIMGWLLVLEYGLAASTVAVSWSGYLVSLLMSFNITIPPELTTAFGEAVKVPIPATQQLWIAKGYSFNADSQMLNTSGAIVVGLFNVPAFCGIWAVTMLLVGGMKESANVNNVIVAIKMFVILAFISLGAFYINVDNWTPFIPEYDPTANKGEGGYGLSGVFRAASIIFFAYVGFEAVSTAAAEAKNPQKDIPFGIIGSLLVCTVLYMFVAAVLTGLVDYRLLSVPDPMAVAVDAIGLKWFSLVIKIGAVAGLSSVMLVLLFGQTRIFYTMSKDGLLPQIFSKVHPKTQTPWINTLLVGLVVSIGAGLLPIEKLGDLVSLGTLAAFSIVCFSVLWLHYKEPNLERPYVVPYKPFVPIAGILACGGLIYSMISAMSNDTKIQFVVFLAIGAVLYVAYGIRHSAMIEKNNYIKER
jgi:APA family basic amino acid/polyamine antiporter